MFIHEPNPHEPRGGTETPQSVFFNRRALLKAAGYAGGAALLGTGAWWGWNRYRGEDEDVLGAGDVGEKATKIISPYCESPRDDRLEYNRPQTDRAEAARHTNFYEFSRYKSVWLHVEPFNPYPWRLTVTGLCDNPLELDLDDYLKQFKSHMTERQYRHRCVEKWAMAVPWQGVPLAALLQAAEPQGEATHVKFVSFERPQEASKQKDSTYPWPYVEGLTIEEAMNDLTFLAHGVYGEPLLKQHGAPLRLVVPWKYGYKSPKSIVRIEFTDQQPETFWTTLNPSAYPFQSNVNPKHNNPWPQTTEQMLGTGKSYPTKYLNGYEQYVGKLYG